MASRPFPSGSGGPDGAAGSTSSGVLLASLQQSVKLQAALLARFEQREARMQATFDSQMQQVHAAVSETHARVLEIVDTAAARIACDAQEAVVPVANRYFQDVTATSTRVRQVGRTMWIWFGLLACAILLAAAATGSLLWVKRGELATLQAAIQRHQDAIPVLEAYSSSDVVLCDGKICANVDRSAPRVGDHRQYQPTQSRQRVPR